MEFDEIFFDMHVQKSLVEKLLFWVTVEQKRPKDHKKLDNMQKKVYWRRGMKSDIKS